MIICIQRIASYNPSAPSNLINPPSAPAISARSPGTTNQRLCADGTPIWYLRLIVLMCHRHRCSCREYSAHKNASIHRHRHIVQKERRGSGPGCVLGEPQVPLGAPWLVEVRAEGRQKEISDREVQLDIAQRMSVGLNSPLAGDFIKLVLGITGPSRLVGSGYDGVINCGLLIG